MLPYKEKMELISVLMEMKAYTKGMHGSLGGKMKYKNK
jgi:hypothetical protein